MKIAILADFSDILQSIQSIWQQRRLLLVSDKALACTIHWGFSCELLVLDICNVGIVKTALLRNRLLDHRAFGDF